MADEKLQGYCMKCKAKRDLGDSLDADTPFVEKKNGRYMLFGWCPEDNTKMAVILGKSNPAHLSIIEAYEKLSKGGKKQFQVNGQPIQLKPVKEERSSTVKTDGKKKSPKKVEEPVKNKKKVQSPPPQEKKSKKSEQKNTKPESKPKTPKKEVKVKAEFPLKIFAEYKGQTHKAIMKDVNNIVMNKTPYSSLSIAALAITDGKHVNGWKFWKFTKDGETYPISAIRDESSIQRLGERTSTKKAEKLIEVPLPAASLPAKNNAKIAAAYYVDPKKFERFGHVVVYLWLRDSQELAHIVFDKHQKAIKPSVRKLGTFSTWKEAQSTVAEDAQEHKYQRAKVV